MIEPLQARQLLLDELRNWLRSGHQLPSVRALGEALGMSYAQTKEALTDLERLGDVRIRRVPGDTRRWVTRVRDALSWRPGGAAAEVERTIERPIRDRGRWPAHATFSDDHRAAGDSLVFTRIPVAEGRSLTGSTAAWVVAEG
jgi:DNA-binding transcriptional MocR family regulator